MAQQLLDRRVFQAGDVIFSEGDAGDRAYLVQKGRVQILRRHKDGETVLREVIVGEVFGAMAAIDSQPRIACARAIDDTICVAVPRALFEQKIAASDPLIAALLRWFVSQARGRPVH
jgi:CRP-like cAMP-binding protein